MEAQALAQMNDWSRETAEETFRRLCLQDGDFCPKCSEEKVYHLKDGRIRCKTCRYTFHTFTRRWINQVRLPSQVWWDVLELFAAGLNTKQVAAAVDVSYNTAYKALSTIRLALVDRYEKGTAFIDAKNEFADFCVRHRRAKKTKEETPCMAPVFGLHMENGGPTRLDLMNDFGVEDIFSSGMIVKTWREIIYTDAFGDYVGLISSCCRRLRESKPTNGMDARVGMDAAGGFWAFAKRYLENYHCLSPETFPLYAKEAEFRFTHRHVDPVPLLAEALCRLVPNRED